MKTIPNSVWSCGCVGGFDRDRGSAGQRAASGRSAVAIDNDDIGGVVTRPERPEAGVWVIAETRDLPVRYIKIVVTDDQGRYVVPDLPKANYDVWVRGYGLVDSPKVKSEPGKQLNLTAVPAPNESGRREVLPGDLLVLDDEDPEAEVFGSKDAPDNIKLTDYLNGMKNNGCVGCHQLGQLSTRTIPNSIWTRARRTRKPGCAASSRVRRART